MIYLTFNLRIIIMSEPVATSGINTLNYYQWQVDDADRGQTPQYAQYYGSTGWSGSIDKNRGKLNPQMMVPMNNHALANPYAFSGGDGASPRPAGSSLTSTPAPYTPEPTASPTAPVPTMDLGAFTPYPSPPSTDSNTPTPNFTPLPTTLPTSMMTPVMTPFGTPNAAFGTPNAAFGTPYADMTTITPAMTDAVTTNAVPEMTPLITTPIRPSPSV